MEIKFLNHGRRNACWESSCDTSITGTWREQEEKKQVKICLVVGAFPYLHKNILKEKNQTILEVRFKQRKRASGLKRLKSKRLSGSDNGKYYLKKNRELKNKLNSVTILCLFFNPLFYIHSLYCEYYYSSETKIRSEFSLIRYIFATSRCLERKV